MQKEIDADTDIDSKTDVDGDLLQLLEDPITESLIHWFN